MWFSNADSDQLICMYELGRHLALYAERDALQFVVIGVEPGYRREQDVRIQTKLVSAFLANRISSSLADHAINIAKALELATDQKLDSICIAFGKQFEKFCNFPITR